MIAFCYQMARQERLSSGLESIFRVSAGGGRLSTPAFFFRSPVFRVPDRPSCPLTLVLPLTWPVFSICWHQFWSQALAQRVKISKIYSGNSIFHNLLRTHRFLYLLLIFRSACLRVRSLGRNQHSAVVACGLPLLSSPAV